MGMLTSNERDALEDVFMSIHSKKSVFNIFKHYNDLLQKSIKCAKLGTKIDKFYKFLHIFMKKKKSLSK